MTQKTKDGYDGSSSPKENIMAIKSISAARRKELLALDDGMAERIKEIMEQHGILDRDLARALDVADRTIYNWKTTGQVSRKLLPLLAEYLNTSTEYLVTGAETDQFQKRTDEINVVQMERSLKSDRTGLLQSLVTRYIGVYEIEELVAGVKDDPAEFRNSFQNFVEQPEQRTSIAITLNPKSLDIPGIPRFAQQILVDFWPGYKNGDYIAYAPDLIPARGDFCAMAYRQKSKDDKKLKWTWVNGFFLPIGQRQVSYNMSHNFYDLESFALKVDITKSYDDDIHITPEHEWALVGTATYAVRWMDNVQKLKQTGLSERLDVVYESRRNHTLACK